MGLCNCGGRDGRFDPDMSGTLMPDRLRWGAWNADAVLFEGDVDLVLAERKVELVASGFRWTEGPTWIDSERTLLFSDTIDARIYRWDANEGVNIWLHDSGGYDGSNVENYDMLFEPGSNGMALNGDDLYVCQHPTHRVVKLKVSEVIPRSRFCECAYEVLADSYEGKRLNAPNDVVVNPVDGSIIWFTDPIYGFLKKQASDKYVPVMPEEADGMSHNPADMAYLDEAAAAGVGHKGVYRWRDGKLELATELHDRPNGLAFSPGGKSLWVANSSKTAPSWTEYAVKDDLPLEKLQTLSETELGEMPGAGVSDGFKIDSKGFIWSSMPNGVCVIDTAAKRVVAKIIFNTNISNIEFGVDGDVWVTGLGHLWRLKRNIVVETE